MRLRKALLLLAAFATALVLWSCGGAGIGTSFGQGTGIYFVDSGNNRIVWVSDMNATFFSSFDTSVSGVATIVNGSIGHNGRVYLIDAATHAIVRFDDIAGDGRVSIGGFGGAVGQFENPVRVAADYAGQIFVVDRGRNALVKFTPNFSVWQTLDLSPWFNASDEPDLTIDQFGHIYLAGGSHIVRLNGMTTTGALVYGTAGTGDGQFNSLTGIALDDQGRIYTADGVNNRISRINDMNGGGWIAFGSTGTGTGQFDIAFGVGVDHNGMVYVGDRNNHRLVRVDNMSGANWTELDNLPSGSFSFVLSVFPHLPNF